jgi:hypothetical protein
MALPQPVAALTELDDMGPGAAAWCVSGRGCAPPYDTPR